MRGAGIGLLFGMQVLLAQWLGPDEFGTYGLVLAWVTLLTAFSVFGAPTAALRFVPEYITGQDRRRLRGVIHWSLGLSLILGALVALVATIVIVGTSHAQSPLGMSFLIGIWIVPLLAVAETQSGISRAFGKAILALTPLWIARPLLILAGLAAIATATGVMTATQAIVVTLVAVGIVTLWQHAVLRREWVSAATGEGLAFEVRTWVRVALPLWLVSLSLLLAQRADLLIIGGFMTTADVGLYEAASRTALLGNMILTAVNFLAAPTFASLHSAGDRASLARTAVAAARLSFWPTVPLVLVLIVFGEQILQLFGDPFVAVRWELAILAVAQLIGAAVGSVGYLLNVTGHQNDTLRTLAITSVASIALNILVIPVWGLRGAAIVTAATTVTWNLWLYALVRRRLRISPSAFTRSVGQKDR